MPRNGRGRGGKRAGKPGAQYPERSDLQQGPRTAGQPVRVASGQQYGQRGQQEASLRAMPLPQTPSPRAASRPAPQAPAGPPPGGLTRLDAPTARPDEPVTAGVPIGPGPGPDPMMQGAAHPVNQLRALYRAFPYEEIRQMLEIADERTADRIAAGMPKST